MNHCKKPWIVTALLLCAALTLSACTSLTAGQDNVRTLIEGNLNDVYLGQFDPDYLKLVDTTEEEAQAGYLEGMGFEAEYFCEYWNITAGENGITYDDLDEDLKSDLIALYQDIYSHTKYEIGAIERTGADSYDAALTVYPIDIMEQADLLYQDNEYAPLAAFLSENQGTVDAMNREQRLAYANQYGKIIAELVRSLLPTLDYGEPISLSLNVLRVDGYLTINNDDWIDFDNAVITYP